MENIPGNNKQDARDQRLSTRKVNLEVIRREYNENILRFSCKDEVRTFAECAKREGFYVVFRCRTENNSSNQTFICLNFYCNLINQFY